MLFAALMLLGQTSIPSFNVPPVTEVSIVFVDRGRTYVVGTQSGTVKAYDGQENPDSDKKPVPPHLTGLANEFWSIVTITVPDKAKRKQGALALDKSIQITEAQAGALGLDMAQIIGVLAKSADDNGIRTYWAGVGLGDLLASKGYKTREELLAALAEIKKACEELSK
jgi:hypothetical protein